MAYLCHLERAVADLGFCRFNLWLGLGQLEKSSKSHWVMREFQKGTQTGRSLRSSLVIGREVLGREQRATGMMAGVYRMVCFGAGG